MGVLHMTMPAAGILPQTPRTNRRAPMRTTTPPQSRPVAHPALLSDTLLPPANPSRPTARHEAIVQRTSEQEAAQEALDRLVRQCMAGDQQAWQQLVVSQHRRIYAICYRFTGSASDAEDLTQDVFLKVYRNLATYDLQRGSFQAWNTTLARNLLADHFRR